MKIPPEKSKPEKQRAARGRNSASGRRKTCVALASAASATVPLLFAQSPAMAIIRSEYFRGNISNTWSDTSGGNTNFTTDSAGNNIATTTPNSTTPVIFYAQNATTGNLSSVLGSNFTIDSLSMSGSSLSESSAVSIASGGAGNFSLTLAPASTATGISLFTGSGALTITAAMVLGAPQMWTDLSSGENIVVNGNISGSSSQTLTLSGTQTVTLGGTAAYLGATTVSGGILNITGSVPNSLITVDQGATLAGSGTIGNTIGFLGGTVNGSGLIVIAPIKFTGASNAMTGSVTVSSGVILTASSTLSLNGTLTGPMTINSAATLTGGGTVTNTVSFLGGTVTGSGINLNGPVIVNGAGNQMGGTISVPSGVSLASSSLLSLTGTLTGAVTVNSAATLTGSGTISSKLTLTGGTVRPGSAAATGALGTGDEAFGDGSTLGINLNSDSAATSVLNSSGNVSLGTAGDSMALLSVTDLGTGGKTLAANTPLAILTATGTIAGQFSGLAEGATVIVANGGNNTYTIDYQSQQVVLIANASAPEPASVSLLGFGALGLLLRRPRRLITVHGPNKQRPA